MKAFPPAEPEPYIQPPGYLHMSKLHRGSLAINHTVVQRVCTGARGGGLFFGVGRGGSFTWGSCLEHVSRLSLNVPDQGYLIDDRWENFNRIILVVHYHEQLVIRSELEQ